MVGSAGMKIKEYMNQTSGMGLGDSKPIHDSEPNAPYMFICKNECSLVFYLVLDTFQLSYREIVWLR